MILELTQAVDRVAQAIDPNELAFLAMTSKLEFPFRDRLAYALALAMPNDERIAREWNRCDLAWLSGSAPRLLVELKACYSFDLVSQPEIYFGHLRRDLLKARILAGPGPACFAVLMATTLAVPSLRLFTTPSSTRVGSTRRSPNLELLNTSELGP